MSKIYTLDGHAATMEFGKGGPLFEASSGLFRARNSANSSFVEGQGADASTDDAWVTLRQLNNATLGLSWKEPVRLASTGNVDIATELEAGDLIDGVGLVEGDRVLLKNQVSAIENGIYVAVAAAAGAAPRSADMATGSDATNAAMFVSEGATQDDQAYVETADPAVVGTDALTFLQFASVTAGVTSLASVDNGGGAGTFAPVLLSGAAPVPTIRSISNGSQIAAVTSSNEIALSIVAGSVGPTELAANAVTEVKLAAGVAELFRYLQVLAAGFPAVTGSNTVNLGVVLPANSIVKGGEIFVSTAFDNGPDLQVGTVAAPDSVFGAGDVNLGAIDSYGSGRMSVLTASTQLVVTRTTGAIQPTVGVCEVFASFARVA